MQPYYGRPDRRTDRRLHGGDHRAACRGLPGRRSRSGSRRTGGASSASCYGSRRDGTLTSDNRAGEIPRGVDISGCHPFNFLTYTHDSTPRFAERAGSVERAAGPADRRARTRQTAPATGRATGLRRGWRGVDPRDLQALLHDRAAATSSTRSTDSRSPRPSGATTSSSVSTTSRSGWPRRPGSCSTPRLLDDWSEEHHGTVLPLSKPSRPHPRSSSSPATSAPARRRSPRPSATPSRELPSIDVTLMRLSLSARGSGASAR